MISLHKPDASARVTAPTLADASGLCSRIVHADLVFHASHTIDEMLRDDPLNQGESRPNNQRILFAYPLGITYECRTAERLVRVLHVWTFKKK